MTNKTINQPRNPTQEELDSLVELIAKKSLHPMESEADAKELFDKATKAVTSNTSYIAVFESFDWTNPTYPQFGLTKMMVVVWIGPIDRNPIGTDLFAWDSITKDSLRHISEEREWEKVIRF